MWKSFLPFSPSIANVTYTETFGSDIPAVELKNNEASTVHSRSWTNDYYYTWWLWPRCVWIQFTENKHLYFLANSVKSPCATQTWNAVWELFWLFTYIAFVRQHWTAKCVTSRIVLSVGYIIHLIRLVTWMFHFG